jgi:Ca2+-binding RTX toxin-like protein
LATFHTTWRTNDDPNGVFNLLLPTDDTLIGSEGDDAFAPGLGSDVVDGGAGGNDEVAYRGGPNRPTGVTVDLNFGDPDDDLGAAWSGGTLIPDSDEFDTLISIENVLGSNLNDLLIGDNHDNTFSPSRGNDTIHGGGGTDELRYDRGPGEPGQGIRVTFTDEGMGTVTANDGTTKPSTDPHPDFGLDTFTGIESIRGTREADMFIGAAGSQRFRGLAGDDYFDGGESLEDEDEVDFSRDAVAPTGTAGVTVDLVLGTASGFDGSDTLLNIEHIRGTNNDDSVTGDGADNRFRGEGGNDTLIGAGGNDRLQGGAGNDTLDGGAGDEDEADYWQDVLIAGGAGVDVDLDHANSSDDNGIAFGPNGDTDTLIGIENARGTTNNDNFIGDAQANRFRGEAGNDTMQGGGGQDQLEGGAGDDWLYGGDDNDFLDGGSGRDRFIGLEGNDTFVGGGGVDLDVAD